jgi:hypothetical protein
VANNDFILNLHKNFNFPLDILKNYIEQNTNINVSDFVKVTEGYDNEVYDIGMHMVKIRRESEVPFTCIEWAVDKCKAQGIKTINIVHCGKILDTDIMIEEKIHGKTLTPDLYHEAGAELRKIHNIRVEGFWRRRENGKFDFADYKELAQSNTRDRLKEMPLICAGNIFSSEHIECMKKTLLQYELLDSTPVLCHGDYAPKHILCEENINGIIDFGNFQGGSGYVDIAYFSLNTDEKYFHKFIEGYGKINEHELLINIVILLMGYIAHSRKIGDEQDAKKLEMDLLHVLQKGFI